MKLLYALAAFLTLGAPAVASGQDMATRGDWRHLGDSHTHTFAWDRAFPRSSGGDLVVRMMNGPLRPEAGADTSEFEIQEVRVNCARRTYGVAYRQAFGAEGRALGPVDPPRTPTPPPPEMQDVAGSPVAVVVPYLCDGVPMPAAGTPVEARLMVREQRSYVNSGAADEDRRRKVASGR